ncbi:hypothetical protein OJAV_G00027560 [Oryzias javanicus]|uniref:START domain-containing protein n=1 Tax=Oryzias javanicus TaxID=123683 RepID=A0A3S2PSH3_ORYJA|nr:hypothetical protein OJAV_G00027560 [Oryzias javanicus]
MDLQQTAAAAAERMRGYRSDETGWMVCKKSNLVVVSWRPSSEFPGKVYKGEGLINASPDKVWECLKPEPDGFRVKWDANVKKFQLLEEISQDVSVLQDRHLSRLSAAMGIIAPRDFVDVIVVRHYEDGTFSSNATNVVHPSCPPQPVLTPTEPGAELLPDGLGGLLPRSVVDSFFPSSMMDFYSNLTKAALSL